MSKPEISTQVVITDWDWKETSRPELRLDDNSRTSALYIGDTLVADIDGKDKEDLLGSLESYRDIFAKGLEILTGGDWRKE